MSHYTHRDASGRVISILHDDDERPSYQSPTLTSEDVSRRPFYSSFTTQYLRTQSTYAPASQRGNASHPNTPDLLRSDSYDSYGSSNEPASPLTPNTPYHEPLPFGKWANTATFCAEGNGPYTAAGTKDGSASLYHGELRLPPISSITKIPSFLEVRHASTNPDDSCRRESSDHHGATMVRDVSSSSSMEDQQDRQNFDTLDNYTRAAVGAGTEAAIHRSIESSGDSVHRASSPASVDHPHALPRVISEDDEIADSNGDSRKGTKGKTTAPRRYPCRFKDVYNCYKTFTTSGHASRHAKIHTAEKTVECSFPGCSRRFTRSDNMKQHLETHKKDKSRASAKHIRRPSLAAIRRQSSSSRSSVSRYSLPRDSPPVVSPGIPGENWVRPIASRTVSSGLDALAMVAATEQATVEQEAQRQVEGSNYFYYQHA